MENSNQMPSNKVQVRYIKDKDLLIVKDESGNTILVSANLVRHAMGIPYVKKDGTKVTAKDIAASQAKARQAYIKAIQANQAVSSEQPKTPTRKAK